MLEDSLGSLRRTLRGVGGDEDADDIEAWKEFEKDQEEATAPEKYKRTVARTRKEMARLNHQ